TRDVGSYISAGGIGQAGSISIISQDGGINTTRGNIESSSEGGFSGNIYLEAKNNISTGNLRSSSNFGYGGKIDISSKNGAIDTTAGSINSTGNGFINLDNPDESIVGNSGNISLNASGNINTGNITSSTNFGTAGNINLISQNGIINTTQGDINSSTDLGIAGNIVLGSSSKITTGNVNSSSQIGNGGNINISSKNGAIDTTAGYIKSTGGFVKGAEMLSDFGKSGNISLNAFGDISTREINSSTYFGTAGNINLLAGGNINLSGDLRSEITGGNGIAGNITLQAKGDISNNVVKDAEGKVISSTPIIINASSRNDSNSEFSTININSSEGSVIFDSVQISTTNFGQRFAGDIVINSKEWISLTNSQISSNGNFGRIFLGKNNPLEQEQSVFPAVIDIKNSSLSTTNKLIDNLNGQDREIVIDGDAGGINIYANLVSLSDISILESNTYGEGDSGNVDIKTQNLTITGGSEVLSQTYGAGDAGDIMINPLNDKASSSVTISGVAPFRKDEQGNEIILDENNNPTGGFSSGLFASTEDAATGDGGNITVNTGTLNIKDGGVISARSRSQGDAGNVDINVDTLNITGGGQILTPAFGSGKGGDIKITASGDINISGVDTEYGNRFQKIQNAFIAGGLTPEQAFQRTQFTVDTLGNSASGGFAPSGLGSLSFDSTSAKGAGNISVTSTNGSIFLNLGAEISTDSNGKGRAGNIVLNARDQIFIQNSSLYSDGNYGLIFIGANPPDSSVPVPNRIDIVNSSVTTNNTDPDTFAGDITLNAKENISLTNSKISSDGNFGLIFIGNQNTSPQMLSLDNSNITATNSSIVNNPNGKTVDSGNISIYANTVELKKKSYIDTATFRNGNAGNISIYANNKIYLEESKIYSTAEKSATGNAGSIFIGNESIIPKQVILQDAQITVNDLRESPSQQPQSQNGNPVQLNSDSVTESNTVADEPISGEANNGEQAGNVKITTDRLLLDNGSITATSKAVNGGNIDLNVKELLLMRNGSQINATAGGTGSGGNVSINTEDSPQGFVVALQDDSPSGNDIIAKADKGEGGEINIYTLGRFGFAKGIAEEGNKTNNIDASSNSGDPGRVTLNTPDTDPDSGLNSLPEDVTDPSNKIDQSCAASKNEQSNEFTITGRGGLPPSPDQIQSGDAVWEDTRPITKNPEKLQSETTTSTLTSQEDTNKITPATGWVFNEKGEVTLVSSTPKATPEKLSFTPKSCPTR
ncbi:MAG: hypothetical protein VKN72_19810, partial [Nostocales cyanobacterium 94392]|nr:hypothetical protein [Nostocales cyanobacterium 94392]